jgi:hypothetical protein
MASSFLAYIPRRKPQFPPQPVDIPQTSLAGQFETPDLAEWATGTLMLLESRFLPQEGHDGFSSPRKRNSNSWPQSWHTYS